MTTRYYEALPECEGCGSTEGRCVEAIRGGAVACCPECKHRRELTIDYEAACWALVNSHAVDAVSEIGGLTLSDVILAVDAALSGDPQ